MRNRFIWLVACCLSAMLALGAGAAEETNSASLPSSPELQAVCDRIKLRLDEVSRSGRANSVAQEYLRSSWKDFLHDPQRRASFQADLNSRLGSGPDRQARLKGVLSEIDAELQVGTRPRTVTRLEKTIEILRVDTSADKPSWPPSWWPWKQGTALQKRTDRLPPLIRPASD